MRSGRFREVLEILGGHGGGFGGLVALVKGGGGLGGPWRGMEVGRSWDVLERC